jgi:hypothetical protein
MKIYYYISVAASALSLVLAIVLSAVGGMNSSLQAEVQKQQNTYQVQQAEIQKGAQLNQKLGPAILQDMANVSVKDEPMRKLLEKYNIHVATPAPGAAGSPAPSKPAASAPATGTDAPALRP